MGDKLTFLEETVGRGYEVVLCFVGLATWRQSRERVAMRVSQGGHIAGMLTLNTRPRHGLAGIRLRVFYAVGVKPTA